MDIQVIIIDAAEGVMSNTEAAIKHAVEAVTISPRSDCDFVIVAGISPHHQPHEASSCANPFYAIWRA